MGIEFRAAEQRLARRREKAEGEEAAEDEEATVQDWVGSWVIWRACGWQGCTTDRQLDDDRGAEPRHVGTMEGLPRWHKD